jgi:hypothetical protein
MPFLRVESCSQDSRHKFKSEVSESDSSLSK